MSTPPGDPVPPKREVLGVGFTRAMPADFVPIARTLIARRDRTSTICSVNVHTFTEALRDPGYGRAMRSATLTFVDGVPVRWILRACGDPHPPPRIHGSDFMALLVRELPDARHYFFGSTPETLALLEASLRGRFPSIRIAGMVSPPFRKRAQKEDDTTLEAINRSGADILWVGLGAPKQELWLHLNADRLRVPIAVAIGAAFDIQAGRYSRAPGVWQKLGLEWAWRLLQDPARLWRRYFSTNGYFLSLLLRESSKRLFRPAPPGSSGAGS
ncbi:MAG TPA: WecB/TagA/CpsF family glycosyltransferase [Planctomycetota bacterium]|nr:WecB/TagA/CpsF family glycosyltransferase [Planctomycetota bacterium]